MRTPTVNIVVALVLSMAAVTASPGRAAAREPALQFSPRLPVSSAMAERVRFWIDIFTRVSHTRAVLHDRDDPTLTYDIVEYGPGGDSTPVEAARASYQRLLATLATEKLDGPFGTTSLMRRLEPPSLERARVEALFGARAGPAAYVRAAGNIRAQRGMKEPFTGGLVRAELYLPAIRKIFREADLPPELVYLPHVESSFNPTAVSRAGAVGLWQFTRATYDRYVKGEERNDGRLDPLRSSQVAAQHLTRAYGVLGSWPLAVASYNHGLAGIARARAAVGADSLDDIVRGYDGESFGFASQNFYAEVLAAAHVAAHARHYFPDMPQPPVMQYVVRPGDSLWTIARRHRISVRDLTAANNLGGSRLKTGQLIVIKTS